MKKLIASSLAAAMLALSSALPALGEPERKTDLVELGGKSVDRIQLRHDIDGVWVIGNQAILYRDTARDHYLVTFKAACKPIERRQGFAFSPAPTWQLQSQAVYKVRFQAGAPCDVAKVEQVDAARADALHAEATRRAW